MSLSKISVPQALKQHHLLITAFLSLSILLSACTSDSNSTESSTTQTSSTAAQTTSAAAQSSDSASDTEIITVSATIFPAYDIARQIAGDKANVSLLLAPGESPHTFNMTPSVQKQISDSVLVFGIGEGLDEWIADSDNFIVLSSGIKLRGWDDEDDHDDHDDHDDDKHKEDDDHDDHDDDDDHDHDDEKHDDDDDHDDHDDEKHDDDDDHDDHDHDDEKHDDDDDHDDHDDEKHDDDDDHDDHDHDDEKHDDDDDHDDHDDEKHDDDDDHEGHDDHHGHDHSGADPHYWLSPLNGIQMAENIATELARVDPENAAYYEANLVKFTEEVTALQAELVELAEAVHDDAFITLHDAWYYFADTFDLNLVGSFEPAAAEEPSPRYLKKLADTVEEHDVHAIFSEPQLSTSSLEGFANDYGLEIAVLDPLGGVGSRDSYQALLRYNIQTLVDTLDHDH